MVRRRQFGSVRQLPSGRWQARFPDASGRLTKAPDTFATKAAAGAWLDAVRTDMARGHFIDPEDGKLTLAAWAEEWLALPGKRASSIVRDRQALAAFPEALRRMPLSAIKPPDVQAAVNARSKAAAPATVVRDFATLRAVLNAAVDAERISRSPARRIVLPVIPRPDREVLTPEGLRRLCDELPDAYRVLVMTAAVLGLRWGEAVGLRVRDVDFERGTVTISQTVKELAGHLSIEAEGKTRPSLVR